MDRRNLLAGSALGAGCLFLGYALFWPESDEERILAVLDRLALAVSFDEPIPNPVFFGNHLAEEFEEIFAPRVHVVVPEARVSLPGERQKLAFSSAKVLSRYGSFDVGFSNVDVQVEERARVDAEATATALVRGEHERDVRPVQFEFEEIDGDWRITSAVVRRPRR